MVGWTCHVQRQDGTAPVIAVDISGVTRVTETAAGQSLYCNGLMHDRLSTTRDTSTHISPGFPV